MRCSGFVLTGESGEVLGVSVGGAGDLAKSHVKGYVRKDGVQVKEHDDNRQAASHKFIGSYGRPRDWDMGKESPEIHVSTPDGSVARRSVHDGLQEHGFSHDGKGGWSHKDGSRVDVKDDRLVVHHPSAVGSAPAAKYDHPNVVGKISAHKVLGDGAKEADGHGDPTDSATTSISFAGRDYRPTGKTGNSLHDKTPVHEFEHEDGHRVWADAAGRVHADSSDEVPKLRQAHEASAGASGSGGAVQYPSHVKNWSDKAHFLEQIPDGERTPEQKAAYKKASKQSMYGKGYSPEYKAYLESSKPKRAAKPKAENPASDDAPADGEVGHHEHKTYGVYHRPGSTVKDNTGKNHKVLEHRGSQVMMEDGTWFHPTKVHKQGEKPMSKALLFVAPESADDMADLAKSHVKGYTRKDGSFVADHDDKRVAKYNAGKKQVNGWIPQARSLSEIATNNGSADSHREAAVKHEKIAKLAGSLADSVQENTDLDTPETFQQLRKIQSMAWALAKKHHGHADAGGTEPAPSRTR